MAFAGQGAKNWVKKQQFGEELFVGKGGVRWDGRFFCSTRCFQTSVPSFLSLNQIHMFHHFSWRNPDLGRMMFAKGRLQARIR